MRIPLIAILLISIAKLETKEPSFNLIKKDGKVEIREYPPYIIAKTSLDISKNKEDNNMFRVLANYIFGGNSNSQSIPMTAPVITHANSNSYDMIFFMLDANTIESLPSPNNNNISIEKLHIGKAITISFGMWATERRVKKYKSKLDEYILKNKIQVVSDIMVAQYNSPWTIPPFRKNELIYQIK